MYLTHVQDNVRVTIVEFTIILFWPIRHNEFLKNEAFSNRKVLDSDNFIFKLNDSDDETLCSQWQW